MMKERETETGASGIFSEAEKQKSSNLTQNKVNSKLHENSEIPIKFEALSTYYELTREFLICASLCHECLIEKVKQKNGEIDSKFQGSSPDEIAICTGAKKIGAEFLGNQLGISKVNFLGEELKFDVKIVSSTKSKINKKD